MCRIINRPDRAIYAVLFLVAAVVSAPAMAQWPTTEWTVVEEIVDCHKYHDSLFGINYNFRVKCQGGAAARWPKGTNCRSA